MEDKSVPYIVYESEAARHERTVKRLLTALLITILLMVTHTEETHMLILKRTM